MDKEFEIIVKGALIHDIGKLFQRAQDNPRDKTHGEWGYEWFKKFFGENSPEINSTITHHSKDEEAFSSNIGLIWYESDNLASQERKQEDKDEKKKWDMYTPLASPFYRVRNPNNPEIGLENIPYYGLKREKIQTTSFERPLIDKDKYLEIKEEFEKDLKSLKPPYSINFLLMLMEKHLSNVPSITMEIYKDKSEEKEKHPDISLYSHCKLTAAIAGCMYHYYKDKFSEKWENNEPLKDEILSSSQQSPLFLLIGGDISGVQKFIYTITSKGALKSLKGRSFYLELLAEHIISELIDKLMLTRCNIIFSGGAHFYILSYNTEKAKETIRSIREQIDDFLYKEFKGAIQLHLDFVEFGKEGFKEAVGIFETLSNKLELSKKKKWFSKIKEMLDVESPDETCLTTQCAVCFREDIPLKELRKGNETLEVCEPCYFQYKLGEELLEISEGNYPVIYKLSTPLDEKDYIKIGDYYYYLRRSWNENLNRKAKAVYRINDFTAKHYEHQNSIYLSMGSYKSRQLGELSDMAEGFGVKRIAVLRMDVDNLGRIFSYSIPDRDRTFSRMASISNGLNQFFKFHLNQILEAREIEACNIVDRNLRESGRNVMIVYSGGDDLFIVGHWLDVLESATDIKKYFELYTGNKFITVSAGIAINHEDYPIYQYAKDAEKLEKLAKRGKEKNSLGLLDNKVMKWSEFNRVIERIKFFMNFLKTESNHLSADEQKLPKTFFYRLLSLSRKFKDEGILILPKMAHLISKAKFKNCAPEEISKIKEVVMNSNEKEWEITELATILILMLMRKGGK